MKIENHFTIALPPEHTFLFLLDLDEVASCVPGGELDPDDGAGSRSGRILVKLGAMRFNYRGRVEVVERDDGSHSAKIRAEGNDVKGQGTAKAMTIMRVMPDSGGSRVDIVADVDLKGKAAAMGAGLVESVASRMVADVASCLEARLLARGSAAGATKGESTALQADLPSAGGSLKVTSILGALLKALWAAMVRFFKRLGGALNSRRDNGPRR
jgi:carbon monoxide dehydrogenase subunit G